MPGLLRFGCTATIPDTFAFPSEARFPVCCNKDHTVHPVDCRVGVKAKETVDILKVDTNVYIRLQAIPFLRYHQYINKNCNQNVILVKF